MEIKKVTDPSFRKYGRVVQGIDFTDLVEAIKSETPLPDGSKTASLEDSRFRWATATVITIS